MQLSKKLLIKIDSVFFGVVLLSCKYFPFLTKLVTYFQSIEY